MSVVLTDRADFIVTTNEQDLRAKSMTIGPKHKVLCCDSFLI
jgi:hypothetical protein